jgi:DNA-binding XRE family transcriptional regulator
MSYAIFKRVFDKSGLSKSELGYIFQVSRQTIYDWAKQDTEPKQAGLAFRFEVYSKALAAAIDKRALPLPTSLPKEVRRQRLLTIAMQLHGLTKPTQLR